MTVSAKRLLPVNAPSLTVTVIVAVPFWFAAGITVTVRLAPLPPNAMFPLGTTVTSDELPLTVRLPAPVSTSPTVKLIGPADVSSFVTWSAMAEIVGAVFGFEPPIGVFMSPWICAALSATL